MSNPLDGARAAGGDGCHRLDQRERDAAVDARFDGANLGVRDVVECDRAAAGAAAEGKEGFASVFADGAGESHDES